MNYNLTALIARILMSVMFLDVGHFENYRLRWDRWLYRLGRIANADGARCCSGGS